MKTQHKRTESAHFPCKSPEPISLLPLDSIIRSWFQLPDFLFQNINFPLSELFQNSFKRKCRLGQSFYQDSSFELCEALERLFAQVSKPLVFSTALVTILRTFDKKSLLYKEIAQLIKQEDFEGKLRAFLLKIRVIEEENLFIAWVSSFILTKKVKTMLDCLIYLKMEYFTHKKSENKLKNSQVEYRMKIIKELLHKGLKLKFREELYEILYQNPFNKVFIDNISKSNEKEIIFIIKDLKFDSHSIFSTFELLLTQAKCYEINEFSLKLLEIFKEMPSAPQMMLSFLIKYDFNDCESFLEGLLEIMRVFLPTTKQDFQEKVHNLIAELQSSESLVLFNQTVDNNNIRESLDSNLEISSKLSKNTKGF